MAFFRSRTGLAVTAPALLVALAMFLFVPFPADTGEGRRLFFAVLLGGFAGFGAWSLAGIPALIRDMAVTIRGAGRAQPASQGPSAAAFGTQAGRGAADRAGDGGEWSVRA